MALVKMKKVQAAIHKEKFEEAISAVQHFGDFEISEINEEDAKKNDFFINENESHEIDLNLAELEFALKLLAPLEEKKKTFREKIIGESVFGSEEDVFKTVKSFDFKPIVKKVADIEENLNQKKSELDKITQERKVLQAWKNLNFSGSVDRTTKHASMRLGEIATRDFTDFTMRLVDFPEIHYQVVNQDNVYTYFFIVFHEEVVEEVSKLLDIFRFSETEFSQTENKPKEQISIFDKQEKQINSDINHLKNELKNLALNTDKLKLVYDYYLWEKEKELTKEKVFKSQNIVLMEGWIPEESFKDLSNTLEKITSNFYLSQIDKQESENAPSEIKNSSFFAPFEIVTEIFGLPKQREIDPTPYLAPFFAIFFGFCLTDAGYGILLSVLTFLAIKYLPLAKNVKKMMRLLFMCGIATIFMGTLFGGWFGLTQDQVPEFLTKDVAGKKQFVGQFFDPMTDLTGKIMILAYGMGFIHLILGIILSGIIKLKNGKVAEAVQTSFFLVVYIIALVIFTVLKSSILSENIIEIGNKVFFGATFVMIWFLGYGKSIFLRIPAGIMGLINEAMGWLSNILSYSRLFALGLATGIIATIFNKLAVVFGEMMPIGLNIIVGLIIILFGHSINIGLNLLGAFIHSGRLQFVEFFGKFIECGGRVFSPLRRKSKYLFTKDS